jgi:hypothetical protein
MVQPPAPLDAPPPVVNPADEEPDPTAGRSVFPGVRRIEEDGQLVAFAAEIVYADGRKELKPFAVADFGKRGAMALAVKARVANQQALTINPRGKPGPKRRNVPDWPGADF